MSGIERIVLQKEGLGYARRKREYNSSTTTTAVVRVFESLSLLACARGSLL